MAELQSTGGLISSEAARRVVPAREGYDRWSEIYDGDGNPLVALEESQVDRLVGDVADLRVVDVGCGTARHALRLAAAGAFVVGMDQSPGMLSRGRQKVIAAGLTQRVQLVEHDIRSRLPLADAAFDLGICCLVLDHIADVAALLREMRRVVKPGSPLVISTMHPAMMLVGTQARFQDPESGDRVYVESSPNQLSDYIRAAVANDLAIAHISEHAVDAELARALPRAEKYLGWPMLLMLKLRVPQAKAGAHSTAAG